MTSQTLGYMYHDPTKHDYYEQCLHVQTSSISAGWQTSIYIYLNLYHKLCSNFSGNCGNEKTLSSSCSILLCWINHYYSTALLTADMTFSTDTIQPDIVCHSHYSQFVCLPVFADSATFLHPSTQTIESWQ